MRVSALIGAGLGLVVALLLVLALTETRHILGNKQFGVPWVSRNGIVSFSAPWLILIWFEAISIPLGYVIGDRMERSSDIVLAVIGALPGLVFGWLLGLDAANNKGTAGANWRIFTMYAGGLIGAALVLDTWQRYRRRWKRDSLD